MVNVNEIVNEINKSIKGFLTDSTYSNSSLNGIAYSLKKDENTMPCYVDLKGNANYIGVDDKYSLSVYHKMISSTPSKPKINQFGDQNKATTVTHNISLIAYGNTNKLKIQKEVLGNYILASFPTNIDKSVLSKESLSECLINVLKLNFDSDALYKREYLKESTLKPYQVLLEVNYEIVYSFRNDCIKTCKC